MLENILNDLNLMQLVFIPLATAIGAILSKLLISLLDNIKSKKLSLLAKMGVRWASEKLERGTGRGAEKHEMVAQWIAKQLKVPRELIDIAIKASVNELRDERVAMGNLESSATTA